MTKIVLAGDYGALADELRAEHPSVTFTVALTDGEQLEQMVDADAMYGWPTREVFLAAERLRWIQRTGTGINQIIDLPELVESDVVLTNSRGPHALPMANHVFAMMLSLAHSLPALMDAQRDHDWHAAKRIPSFVDLEGRVVGILALGDIGKAVAPEGRGLRDGGLRRGQASRDAAARRFRPLGAGPPRTICSRCPTGSSSRRR